MHRRVAALHRHPPTCKPGEHMPFANTGVALILIEDQGQLAAGQHGEPFGDDVIDRAVIPECAGVPQNEACLAVIAPGLRRKAASAEKAKAASSVKAAANKAAEARTATAAEIDDL